MPIEKSCIQCGGIVLVKPSAAKRGHGKFCSRKCKGEWQRENKTFSGNRNPSWRGGVGRVTITRKCKICGIEFQARKVQVKNGQGKFCSRQCKGKALSGPNGPAWKGGRIERICRECGKVFRVRRFKVKYGEGIYCSRKCMGLWLSKHKSGENSHNWKGGQKEYPREFNSIFKREIRERDNHICAICKMENARCVHHIDYIREHTFKENCITICVNCHGKTNANRKYWAGRLAPIAQGREEKNERNPATRALL